MTKTLFDYGALGRVLSGPANWLFRVAGWRVEGAPPDLPKYIVVAAPHTSNWDFLIMVCLVLALRVPIHWLGKHTVFRKPFDAIFLWLGGIAVDRTKAGNTVEQLARVFAERERFVLIIAPEGSRKQVGRWKSGFYYIAKEANVPMILASLDYARRTVTIGAPFYATGDVAADAQRITAFFAPVVGKFPQEMAAIELQRP